MPNQPAMTNEEKRCLTVATAFLKEALDVKATVGGFRMLGADAASASGPMLGEIAADKFRDCMRKPSPHPAPQR